MPGGRLDRHDRRRIEAGLLDGLGYAEIARRLGRPTSTISREVSRNGGSRGYRADPAHDATTSRARRAKPARPDDRADPASAHERATAAFEADFAEQMIIMGVPRMPARVITALYTADHGLTAGDLVAKLRVSPASVSKAVGYLEGLEMLTRERPAGRRERYVVEDDVWTRAWAASAKTNATMAETAHVGAALFDPASPTGTRLRTSAEFLTRLSVDMSGGPAELGLGDVLDVLAALVHAGAPLTVDELAAGLGWPHDRVVAALRDAEQHPHIADPITVVTVADRYTFGLRPGRLTDAQRTALRG